MESSRVIYLKIGKGSQTVYRLQRNEQKRILLLAFKKINQVHFLLSLD